MKNFILSSKDIDKEDTQTAIASVASELLRHVRPITEWKVSKPMFISLNRHNGWTTMTQVPFDFDGQVIDHNALAALQLLSHIKSAGKIVFSDSLCIYWWPTVRECESYLSTTSEESDDSGNPTQSG